MQDALSRRAILALLATSAFASRAQADAVTDWNAIATSTIPPLPATGPVGNRVLGYVHVAVFDAVNAVGRRYVPYKIDLTAPGASAEAAAMAAAHGVLAKIYPGQRVGLDETLANSLAALPDGKAKEDGITLGRLVAERSEVIIDDFGAPDPAFEMGTTPSSWRPYPPGAAARGLNWSRIKPFALRSNDQFALPGPLSVRSPEYARELEEVRRFGGRDSSARTAEQTATAIFYTIGGGPLFNDLARKEALAKRLDLADTARLLALINMATSDALVVGMREKWRHDFLRPVTAIRGAKALGNPHIEQDDAWEPLLITPSFPDYPALHSTNSGAGATILRRFFGTDAVQAESSQTHPPLGVTHRWRTYTDLVRETSNARVWGGIHTRTACEHGERLGQQVADYVFDTFLRPVEKKT